MISRPFDIVFYHESSFEGDSIETRPLGGTETAEIYLSRELAKLGLTTAVFCRCSRPGEYSGVSFMDISGIDAFFRQNSVKMFVAQTNPAVLLNENINAKVKAYWTGAAHTVRAVQLLKDRKVKDRINKFIFVSNWQAGMFMKRFAIEEQKVFVTRNGVNLDLFKDPSIKRQKYRLLYSSEPCRGLDVLLDVFPKVKKDFPELELYLFSGLEFYGQAKGSGAQEYKHIFDKAKQPGVHNLGNVKQSDLAKEFLKTYVFAYPCHFEETSCISAIEAQAAGVPVVTSALAALKETVADGVTGKLISGNATSWLYKMRFVRELKNLLKDETLWGKMSVNGMERAGKYYSWSAIAKEWLEEFKKSL